MMLRKTYVRTIALQIIVLLLLASNASAQFDSPIACPNGIQDFTVLLDTNPFDNKGNCYHYDGRMIQLLDRSQGLYAFFRGYQPFALIDSGKKSAEIHWFVGVVKGEGAYSYLSVDGRKNIIHRLRAISPKRRSSHKNIGQLRDKSLASSAAPAWNRKICPHGIETIETLYALNPYDNSGHCYEYPMGQMLQLVGRNQALFSVGGGDIPMRVFGTGDEPFAFIEFGKRSVPPSHLYRFNGIVKGEGAFVYQTASGAQNIIHRLSVVPPSKKRRAWEEKHPEEPHWMGKSGH